MLTVWGIASQIPEYTHTSKQRSSHYFWIPGARNGTIEHLGSWIDLPVPLSTKRFSASDQWPKKTPACSVRLNSRSQTAFTPRPGPKFKENKSSGRREVFLVVVHMGCFGAQFRLRGVYSLKVTMFVWKYEESIANIIQYLREQSMELSKWKSQKSVPFALASSWRRYMSLLCSTDLYRSFLLTLCSSWQGILSAQL